MSKENEKFDIKLRSGQAHYVSEIDETGLGAVDAVDDDRAPTSTWKEAWRNLRRRPLFWFSSLIIGLVVLMAIVPQLFTSLDPTYCTLDNSLVSSKPGHILGFNKQGCDIYARLIYGSRASVLVGIFTTIMVVIIGCVLGIIAGYMGGWIDAVISRIIDTFYAIPFMLAAIVMSTIITQRTIFTVVFIMGVFGWVQIARIVRGATLSAKNDEYVTSARALGATKWRIMVSHILPNVMAPVIVYATVALGQFIVTEATLSFLGVGLPPTIVSWGGDIAQAQTSIRVSPMTLFYPALGLAVTVLGFIMMGDAVRDALDPKARKK